MSNLWDHFPNRDAAIQAFAESLKEENEQYICEPIMSLYEENIALQSEFSKKNSDDRTGLEERLLTLEQENQGFKESIQNAKIASALEELSDKYKVRPEARRDIRRLAADLKVDETGAVVTKDNVSLHQFFVSELEASPHWLPASYGGGSAGGSYEMTVDSRRQEEYAKARELVLHAENIRQARIGILDMIRNAPVRS